MSYGSPAHCNLELDVVLCRIRRLFWPDMESEQFEGAHGRGMITGHKGGGTHRRPEVESRLRSGRQVLSCLSPGHLGGEAGSQSAQRLPAPHGTVPIWEQVLCNVRFQALSTDYSQARSTSETASLA